nr:MAG TPA: hypothetical protein [Caudoviricetes sp.]
MALMILIKEDVVSLKKRIDVIGPLPRILSPG